MPDKKPKKEPKAPPWAPSKYHDKMPKKAYDCLKEGFSMEVTAARLKVSKQTLYNWLDKDSTLFKPHLFDAVERGYQEGREYWEKRGKELAETKETIPGVLGYSRGSSQAWAMNMKNRYKWRDRVEDVKDVDLPGSNDYDELLKARINKYKKKKDKI